MLNWIVWNETIFSKMDLVLNNPQRLICHKTQTTNNKLKRDFKKWLEWKVDDYNQTVDQISELDNP